MTWIAVARADPGPELRRQARRGRRHPPPRRPHLRLRRRVRRDHRRPRARAGRAAVDRGPRRSIRTPPHRLARGGGGGSQPAARAHTWRGSSDDAGAGTRRVLDEVPRLRGRPRRVPKTLAEQLGFLGDDEHQEPRGRREPDDAGQARGSTPASARGCRSQRAARRQDRRPRPAHARAVGRDRQRRRRSTPTSSGTSRPAARAPRARPAATGGRIFPDADRSTAATRRRRAG